MSTKLQELVQKWFPGALLLSRKPTNHSTTILSTTGKVLLTCASNKDMLRGLEEDGERLSKRAQSTFGLGVAAREPDNSTAIEGRTKQAAVYALSWLAEIQELNRGAEVSVERNENGTLLIVVAGREYKL